MNVVCGLSLATVLLMMALHGNADSSVSECLQKQVEAHVRQQFAIYGPRSAGHEYFGFIYLRDGEIASAVTRSRGCATVIKCAVDSSEAIRSMPRPAQVLGEWHSHPHGGSPSLSKDDVRGAYGNRHISCYLAFYSTPSGEIYAWNANQSSVAIAMASRTQIGNYRQEGADRSQPCVGRGCGGVQDAAARSSNAQACWAPARPCSTTNDASVLIGASSASTLGTTR